jgi:hypothetical protein
LFPAPGLKKPGEAKLIQGADFRVTRKIGDTSFLDYSFDEPWELVPGTWTFQLWQGNRKLAEKSFTVVKP